MVTLNPIHRSPIGRSTGPAFVCSERGCQMQQVTTPIWDPTAEGATLRRERLARREGLRECAVRLGLLPSQLSSLETGQETLPAGEWALLLDATRRAK